MTKISSKCAELAQEQIAIEATLSEIKERQRSIVNPRIQRLKNVGQSVYAKCMGNQGHDESKAILGDLHWVNCQISFESIGTNGVKFEAYDYRARTKETIEISNRYLSMSDRDFAKIIRGRCRQWKQHQKKAANQKLTSQINAQKRALNEATKQIELLEAQLKNATTVKLDSRTKA